MGLTETARYEIDFRLAQKEPQFAQALLLATDVRLDAVARDALVVPGQPVQVDLMAANRGKSAVVTLDGRRSTASRAGAGRRLCEVTTRRWRPARRATAARR